MQYRRELTRYICNRYLPKETKNTGDGLGLVEAREQFTSAHYPQVKTKDLKEQKQSEAKKLAVNMRSAENISNENAKMYLEKFSSYEKQLELNPYGLTISDIEMIKDEMNEILDKEIELLVDSSIRDVEAKISPHDENSKKMIRSDLKEYFQVALCKIRDKYFESRYWKQFKADRDLMKMIDSLRFYEQKLAELHDKAVAENSVRLSQFEDTRLCMVSDYSHDTEKWLKAHEAMIHSFFPGKTIKEIQNDIIHWGIFIGKVMQAEIADPKSGNTLLHWVNQLFHLSSKDEAYQNRLIDLMIILFYSGSAIQVRNHQGNKACDLEKIKFSTLSGWKAMTALLYTSQTVSELVEELRSKLYKYSDTYRFLLIDGETEQSETTFKIIFKNFFYRIAYACGGVNVATNIGRIPKTGSLIDAMIEATVTMDDTVVVRALQEITDNDSWKTGLLARSEFRSLVNEVLSKYQRNALICYGVSDLIRLRDSDKRKEINKKLTLLEEKTALLEEKTKTQEKEMQQVKMEADETRTKFMQLQAENERIALELEKLKKVQVSTQPQVSLGLCPDKVVTNSKATLFSRSSLSSLRPSPKSSQSGGPPV